MQIRNGFELFLVVLGLVVCAWEIYEYVKWTFNTEYSITTRIAAGLGAVVVIVLFFFMSNMLIAWGTS